MNPATAWLWGGRIMALEVAANYVSVRAFSRETGRQLWTYGRQGHGPGEIGCIAGSSLTTAGYLWLLDTCNRKILELDSVGRLNREFTPATPSPQNLLFVGERALVTTQRVDQALMWVDAESLEPQRVMHLPWPDSIDSSYLLNFSVDTLPARSGVVLAYRYGPAFIILRDDSVSVHRYITDVPFAKKGFGRGGTFQPFAAHSMAVIEDEIFFLFGGTSNRVSPVGRLERRKPAELIDVYGTDGSYSRSYKLPEGVNGRTMSTVNGREFLLLVHDPNQYPQILYLRAAGE